MTIRIAIDGVEFEWDERKEDSNIAKHGVDFGEAATVFSDPLASIFDDLDHSMDEQRELIIGYSADGVLLTVAFAEREARTRIISARAATRRERTRHEEATN